MLDECISVSHRHGIILLGIRVVGLFPPIRHAVTVTVLSVLCIGVAFPKVPTGGRSDVECVLIADDVAFLAQ